MQRANDSRVFFVLVSQPDSHWTGSSLAPHIIAPILGSTLGETLGIVSKYLFFEEWELTIKRL
jgi:hypothetical protein